jgi:hypothetical protein
MRSCAIVAAACLLIQSVALAQPQWQRTYGGAKADGAKSVQQTADGGYIVAGGTWSYGAGAGDVWLIKTNSLGDTVWTRAFGGDGWDLGNSVRPTADGGYIIAAYTESFGAGNGDIWLIKTDSLGDTAWTRTYGGVRWDDCYSVRQTDDGGYVVAGITESYGSGGPDAWLVKTDSAGDTIWTRTYGGTSLDEGHDVIPTSDGGYVIAASTMSFGAGSGDAWLIRTDSAGDTVWTRTYGGSGAEYVYSATLIAGRGYVITGATESYGAGGLDVWLVKTDARGDTAWTRAYGGTGADEGWSVRQTSDGGYAVAGCTESFGAGASDVWLLRTDGGGDTLWTSTYGDTGLDESYSVLQTADLGYIIAGATTSVGAGSYDAWLIKIGPDGPVAVAEPQLPAASMPASTTSIVRGLLSERGSQPAALVDMSGRKVLELRRGANDVGSLVPGVYFVRETQAETVRKVVVTK